MGSGGAASARERARGDQDVRKIAADDAGVRRRRSVGPVGQGGELGSTDPRASKAALVDADDAVGRARRESAPGKVPAAPDDGAAGGTVARVLVPPDA